uniref:Large ribosomal subunit protein uL11 N-terminal domain-containing protein n=1 Tax=Melopsittacus undulatus TaxID=13146 RepID=A0A8V5GNZ3_MELUD
MWVLGGVIWGRCLCSSHAPPVTFAPIPPPQGRVTRGGAAAAAGLAPEGAGRGLSPRGVSISAFCQDFNERTRDIKPGVPLRVKLRVHVSPPPNPPPPRYR